jgi:hypothetical protein
MDLPLSVGSTEPHRPFKIVYASLYADVPHGLPIAVRQPANRQRPLRPRRRNPRTHLR